MISESLRVASRPGGAGVTPLEVDAAAAGRLLDKGEVQVLDVRTPDEYATLGHIPGAILLPADLIASGAATLPRDARPYLVVCEHGVRSAHAARLLAQAGFDPVLNLTGGMSEWSGPREHGAWDHRVSVWPSTWLLENADLLQRGARALDVACGRGRHALLLAAAGLQVRAIDHDPEAIGTLRSTAARLGLSIDPEVADLEKPEVDLGEGVYGLILVIHFLHRPLFPVITRALAPGGLLLYETFTADQAARGRPTNPDFLLRRGELRERVAPLMVLREREGEFEGRCVASVAARRPDSGDPAAR